MDDMAGSIFGHLLQVTNFGESHGPAIGCVIDGCPPGMALRRATCNPISTGASRDLAPRHAAPRGRRVEILSGVFEGKTTGTPIALLIRNATSAARTTPNAESFRPGHADYTYCRSTECAIRAAAGARRRA